MITTFNTQAQASSLSGTVPSGQTERPDAEKAFKALDSGNKGYLTADDLQAAVVKISSEGAKRAQASQGADAAGKAAPSAQDVLAKLDSDGDGKVTQQEFKSGEPKAPPAGDASGGASGAASGAASAGNAGGAQAAKPAGGQPPAAAAGGAGGGSATQATGSSASASSTKTYEPADVNEDGTVSPQEQTAYDAKLAAEKAAEKAAASGRSAEAGAAVKAYAAVEQLGKDSGTTTAA